MIPTLKAGHGTLQKDRVFINKLAYDFGGPQRGDIVLFESLEGGEDDLIKRVIAVEGDTVEIRNGVLYLNGESQAEPYLKRPKDYSSFGPETVPEDHVFVMGDNRPSPTIPANSDPFPRTGLSGRPSCTTGPRTASPDLRSHLP